MRGKLASSCSGRPRGRDFAVNEIQKEKAVKSRPSDSQSCRGDHAASFIYLPPSDTYRDGPTNDSFTANYLH